MKRWLRRIALALAASIALTAIALIGALVAIRSEAGCDRIRAEILERTRALFAGELRIGRMECDLTSYVAVHDVELRDREGRPAIAVGMVRAEYALGELIDRLHVERVTIDRLAVQAFSGESGLNLEHLFVSAEPSEPSEPGEPPSLSIGAIALKDASFALDRELLAQDLDLSLGFAMVRGAIEVGALDLSVDGARIESGRTSFDPATMALDAPLLLDLPAPLLARLAGDPALAGDARLELLARHRELGEWQVDATGAIAGAPLVLRATAANDFSGADARLSLKRIDPHRVHGKAPVALLDLSARAHLRGGDVAVDLNTVGTLTASTTVVALAPLTATATLARGRLSFAAALDSASDRVRAKGALRLEGMVLEETRVEASIASLRPYLPPDLPLDAQLSLDASAVGPITAPKARARAEVRRLKLNELSFAKIDLDADLDERGRGSVSLLAGGGAPIRSIDLRTTVELKDGVRLAISRADVRQGDARISLAPTTIAYSPSSLQIAAKIATPAGDLSAAATLDPNAPLVAPGTIEVRAPELSLERIAELLPEPQPLAGRASLAIAGTVGPSRDLRVELELAGVSFRGSAPVDGAAKLHLSRDLAGTIELALGEVARAHGLVSSTVPEDPAAWRPDELVQASLRIDPIDLARAAAEVQSLGGPKLELAGTASVVVAVVCAGDRFRASAGVFGAIGSPLSARASATATASVPRDPSTWASIDHRALEQAELAVEPIDVRTLAQLAGVPPPLDGRVSLNARVGAAFDRISAALDVEHVTIEEVERPFDAKLRAEAAPRRVNVQGVVRAGGEPTLLIDATLGAGVGDILEGASIVERAKLDGTVRLLAVPLAALSQVIEREDAFAGTLSGTATVAGTIASPKAHLALAAENARFGAMDFDRFVVSGSYRPDGATAELDLSQAIGGALLVRSKIGFEKRAIELNAQASRFSIDFVNDVIPEQAGVGFGGRLDADLSLSGKPEDLIASGWLTLTDGRLIPPPPLATLESVIVDVKAKERSITASVKARSGEGELTAEVRTDRDAKGLSIDGKMTTEDLPLSLGKTPVALDLGATITGAITSEETRISTVIDEGSVEVAEREARELYEVESLDDVVFVDARGKKEQKKAAQRAPSKPSRTEIEVRTASPLPVNSKDLNATVVADIRITGGRVFGKVTLGEGAIQIGGRPWRIERARIDLDGSAPPRPVLDVLLVHEFQTVVVSIIVTGTPDHPDVRFESSPATYDQAALLGIVLGSDPDDPSNGTLETKAAGAATNYVVGAIRSGLGQDLWLDTLSVDLDEKYAAKVQLGKWITREIFLGYEHDFGATELENAEEAIFRYRFLPGWMIESRIGDKAQGLDLFWTKRF